MLIYSPAKITKFKRPNRINRKWVIMLIIVGIIAVVTAFIIYQKSEYATRKIISHDTQQLLQAVEDIDHSLKTSSEPSAADIKKYINNLQALTTICGRLKNTLEETEKHNFSDVFKKQNKDTSALCTDLESVATYSQDVYTSTSDYLMFQFTKDIETLDELLSITSNALNALGNIRNNINDPAYDEIKTQLTTARELFLEAKKSANSPSADTDKTLSQLEQSVKSQQKEIWQRRVYFWNNTVLIDRLVRTLKSQQERW